MKSFCVTGGKSLTGGLQTSPSKSQSLRAILFASMADGKSIIHNYLQSPDAFAMINACQQLGAVITEKNGSLEIIGIAGKPILPDNIIDAGNSGQVVRFVGALAALIEGYSVLTGDHSIRHNRPIQPLIDGLSHLGANCISTKNDGYAPLIVQGPITAGKTYLDGEDSQPVSALLMASIFLKGKTEIIVTNPGEVPWIQLTLNWLDRFGVNYTNDNFSHYQVEGLGSISAFEYTVPGDFSSLAFPIVAALITHSQVTLENVDLSDVQGDKKIIDVLQSMGAEFEINGMSLTVKKDQLLKGYEIDMNDLIDALPILAVVGCYATGTTKLTNAAIARKKESDRIATITNELRKMGANIEELDDGLIIHSCALQAATVESYHDHRIAMALAVAASGIKGKTIINNIKCVDKSYADFYSDMKSLGCEIELA